MIRSFNTLALRNIREARLRTLLSIVVVVTGVAMMIATDGFSNALVDALPGAEDGQNMGSFALEIMRVMLWVINVVILLAAGFLIFNAFLMSVTERRQQIGMLRSLGMTRRQILRLIVTEGLLIGSVGTFLGVIAGPLTAMGLLALMWRVGGAFFTASGHISFSMNQIILAAVLGMGVTLIAVLFPAWNAMRISPLTALRHPMAGGMQRSSRRRAGIAVLVIAILFSYLIVSPPGEWVNSPLDVQLTGLFILIWLICVVALLPILIESAGYLVRTLFSKRWKAAARLIGDNLERERQRVMLTVLTLSVSLMMIIGMSGINQFLFFSLLLDRLEKHAERSFFAVLPFDMNAGLAAFSVDSLGISDEIMMTVEQAMQGIADVVPLRLTFIPELTAMTSGMYSYVLSAEEVQQLGDFMFSFTEGDWEMAAPIMETGCGVLVVPMVANKNGIMVGDHFTVEGKDGPVECTLAGIGTITAWITIISNSAADFFEVTPPMMAVVIPRVGVDSVDVEARLVEIASQHDDLYFNELGKMVDTMSEMTGSMTSSMNAILVIAILAAALGIINTTMMNVHERRHELGLMRSLGATRSQVRGIIIGEAILMGFVGAVVGVLAGIGMTIIFIVTFGGNSFGIFDIPLWETALESVQAVFLIGTVGMIAAPLISAFAAWLPARTILRGTTITTMNTTR